MRRNLYCRSSDAIAVLLGGCLATGSVCAQHGDSYDVGYDASADGTIITGQQGFYIPVPDSQDGLVYTYLDNALGLPANPTGGTNFVGSTGGEATLPVPFARSQRDVPYPELAFRIAYDVCVTKVGDLLTADNIGSFSTQRTPGGSDFGHIDLFTWEDPLNAVGWNCNMVWFDDGGVQVNEQIPELVGFVTNKWYRRATTVAGDTNRIVEISVTDIATGETITVFPIDRYAVGGPGGFDLPTGFRYFAGCSNPPAGDCNEGNTLAWDNLTISAIPPTGSCCVPDTGDCLADVTSAECSAASGVFNGIGTVCGFPECFQFGPDGWVIEAPITWNGDTCGRGDDCDLENSEDERWEVTIPWDQTWTFTVCDQADFDTWMYLGDSGCTQFINNDDCLSGTDSEIVVDLVAGTYFLTLEAFEASVCGEFQLDIFADCPLVPDNPACIDESGEFCMDEDTDPANVGCNAADGVAPTFDDISCGDTRCGTVGNFTFTVEGVPQDRRDLDWYRLEITDPSTVTMTAFGSYPEVIVFLAELNNTDIDGSGFVDFGDILAILAAWGQMGVPADIDGSGTVDFGDILQVLSGWGKAAGDTACDGPGSTILVSDSTTACAQTVEISFDVDPGMYALIITTDFDNSGGVPCGVDSSYEFSVTCTTD